MFQFQKFVELFVAGILALNDKNWENVVSFMESSVMQYIFDENQVGATIRNVNIILIYLFLFSVEHIVRENSTTDSYRTLFLL